MQDMFPTLWRRVRRREGYVYERTIGNVFHFYIRKYGRSPYWVLEESKYEDSRLFADLFTMDDELAQQISDRYIEAFLRENQL